MRIYFLTRINALLSLKSRSEKGKKNKCRISNIIIVAFGVGVIIFALDFQGAS